LAADSGVGAVGADEDGARVGGAVGAGDGYARGGGAHGGDFFGGEEFGLGGGGEAVVEDAHEVVPGDDAGVGAVAGREGC